ncbi:cation transporter HKT1;3-like isoform X2 [Syzygium oleosum]|uniref:cation transporter HKT1;3-like isoform X2 n=1 Tax=Syzygium oleosum TaxID=219896 RepID=UPI0024BB53A7|nr:cation transporter HKT1;3-like isoform X2 [Syzygium oleosum]
MKKLSCFGNRLEPNLPSIQNLSCLLHSCHPVASSLLRKLSRRANSFWTQLAYFVLVSAVGYWALKLCEPKSSSYKPRDLDVFFTSVSATTVSSMSTVEMEAFSHSQLVIMTLLMLFGGEIFTSMVGLHLSRYRFAGRDHHKVNGADTFKSDPEMKGTPLKPAPCGDGLVKYRAAKYLSYVVLGYLIIVHAGGSTLLFVYISLVPTAKKVLWDKGLAVQMFSVFMTVSTFANCGFVPMNENMLAFKHHPGLLWLLLPQVLLGNTLYPPCLRVVLWLLERVTGRAEFDYMLRNSWEMGYAHLLPGFHCLCLASTVWKFVLVQFVALCCMEWGSPSVEGLSPYEKLVGALFEAVNTRHAGESVFDLSIISPAILVLFVLMMYLPSHTSFLPVRNGETAPKTQRDEPRRGLLTCLMFSQLSYLVIFIILICITERENLKNDPLNFNVLNITIETISAYGNVGFSIGYSCKKWLNTDSPCRDAAYGFVGKWSNKGKFILIIVMFFGRLKKFNMKGGTAWSLS